MAKGKRKSDRPDIRPSNKVKRCLFREPDNRDKEEECRKVEETFITNLEKMKVKYNYDFVEERHLSLKNTPFTVAKIIEASGENDLNAKSSSTFAETSKHVEKPSESSTMSSPKRRHLAEDDSESNKKSMNATLNGRMKYREHREQNCTCDVYNTFAESDRQSKT